MRRFTLAASAAIVLVLAHAGCPPGSLVGSTGRDGGAGADGVISPLGDGWPPADSAPRPDAPPRRPDAAPRRDSGAISFSRCAGAKRLTLKGGHVRVVGNSRMGGNEFGKGIHCGRGMPMRGPQVYYRLAMKAGKVYRVRVVPGYRLSAFYIFRSTCTPASINADCGSGGKTGDVASVGFDGSKGRINFRPTLSGDYTIAVDNGGLIYDGGPFVMTIDELRPPTNGTCRAAAPVTLVKGRATVTGDTSLAANEFGASITCRPLGGGTAFDGPQAYYRVPLTAGKRYAFTLRSGAGTFFHAAYLFRDTCTAAAINADCGSRGKTGAMIDATHRGRSGVLLFTPAASGTYTVAVDSAGPRVVPGSDFALDIAEVTRPPNTVCKQATRVALTGGRLTIEGSTVGAVNEFGDGVRCGSLPNLGRQVYYKVLLEKGHAYAITLDTPFSARLNVFRARCDPVDITLDCGSGGKTGGTAHGQAGRRAVVKMTPAASGDYILSVDSFDASAAGGFTLTVSKRWPAVNTTCARAETVVLAKGVTTIFGTIGRYRGTNEFGNDITCGTRAFVLNGRQVYYRMDLKAGTRYTFALTPQFSTAFLYIFGTTCTSAAINADCGSGGKRGALGEPVARSRTGTLTFTPATSGTYTVAVDSMSYTLSAGGPFTLTVRH